ncbi:6340_t:CDS:2 [Ambispora gerdemannii]|uniref:FAD synthase n=1 Tax=Ambispora gerdemannii TaxID=144530 RepID=A0A9N8VUG3_9GLOM|nr:6340_t:CDS:2 [Ambispora gerdemannii]
MILEETFVDSSSMDNNNNKNELSTLSAEPITNINGWTHASVNGDSSNGDASLNREMILDDSSSIQPTDLAKIYEQVYSYAETPNPLQASVKHSLEIIEEALNRYGANGLALSFNGGKDCTVLLHLFSAALYKFTQKFGEKIPKIQCVYITPPNPFAEVDTFVEESIRRYGLDLIKLKGPMKQALASYLKQRPSVKGILVVHLSDFAPTDPGWPNFMRIHPILDWHYNQIWEFLRNLKVPYCDLYNLGYTSLGSTVNTRANPDLRNPNNPNGFDPAWKLTDESKERSGRAAETYTTKTIPSNSTTSVITTKDESN